MSSVNCKKWPNGRHWAEWLPSDLGRGPSEASHQQGGVQGLSSGLCQFLHSSPMFQHCVEQVLDPGASECVCLLTQSCLLWGGGTACCSLMLVSLEQGLAHREALPSGLCGLGLT